MTKAPYGGFCHGLCDSAIFTMCLYDFLMLINHATLLHLWSVPIHFELCGARWAAVSLP